MFAVRADFEASPAQEFAIDWLVTRGVERWRKGREAERCGHRRRSRGADGSMPGGYWNVTDRASEKLEPPGETSRVQYWKL